jgi:hypothetical protein
MKFYQFMLFSIVASGFPVIEAATTSVNIVWGNSTTTGTEFKDRNGNLLTAGTTQAGDGAVLELGYYTEATLVNPFSGTWVPLTGPGTGQTSTIGDLFSQPNGIFTFGHHFQSDSPNVPTIGTPLAIRFYDSTSLATANYFNCVSNTGGYWNWTLGTPEPTVTVSFKTPPEALVWQDGSASAFRTTIAVPELSAALLAASGALLAFRRRRT